MNAEIITIGDEILIGQIIDTNSAFIAKELNKIGVSVFQITSIQDEKEHILQTFKEAEQRADIIIVTGGLGPTKDDITKKCFCDYFDDELVQNDEVLKHVEYLFETYIDTPISDLNRLQAMVPSKAIVLKNQYGTAPGMFFENGEKVFVSLPGVPYEMKALITDEVLPKLQKKYSRPVLLHKTVLTYGLGESAIANKIENWEDSLPDHIKLAYLPNLGKVRLRLSGRGFNEEQLEKDLYDEIEKLKVIIGDIIYGLEEESPMEETLKNLFAENGFTLATAESYTGGQIASLLTSVSGASSYFSGSMVTYATQSKIDLLNVPAEIIQKHSVVSAEVAEAMASGVLQKLKTDFAISTTGNAGPSKGDSDADLGTVYIGIATPSNIYSEKFSFGNHREKVVGKAVNKSLQMIRKALLEHIAE